MQMPENHDDQQDDALQAPPRLVSALKQLPKAPIFIPPTLDDTLLRAAHRHLVRPKEPKWLSFFPWVAAAAAVLLLLAVIPHFFRQPGGASTGGSSFAREDVNHDGQVDILDAFALARQLRGGTTPNLQLDVNGDGVVDERDVAAVAARAVRLEKGGRS
jgi:hypothetical protein